VIRLGLLVSGHAEVEALPVLLRRLLAPMGVYPRMRDVIRAPESTLLKKGDDTFERQIQRLRASNDAVLVLIDLEDDCPKQVAPTLQARAAAACSDKPCYVVCAYRELETWFMWDAQALLGCAPHPDPEAVRGAKKWIKQNSPSFRGYNGPADSPKLFARLDLSLVKARSDSFRVLTDRVARIAKALTQPLTYTPPTNPGDEDTSP
jgi:hypothetical protein